MAILGAHQTSTTQRDVRRATQSLPGAVKADVGLQEKLKAAIDADAVVEIANGAGYAISVEELKSAQAEVSEEELESVAGGGAGECAGAVAGVGAGAVLGGPPPGAGAVGWTFF